MSSVSKVENAAASKFNSAQGDEANIRTQQ